MKGFLSLLLFLAFGILVAQNTTKLDWYKVAEMELGGRVKAATSSPFQRFPDSMQDLVRKKVWDLSENPSGVYVDFETDSPKVIVKYVVNGPLQFPHMPATGVSGVDLYVSKNNSWKWVKANYQFQDTISYSYRVKEGVNDIKHSLRLYLPLYNTVSYMEIGVDKHASFRNLPISNKAPIVVYGTSITQGACSGRPGTTWTSLMSRQLDIPVFNYGFSGNGRLEEEIIRYLAQLKAEVFVLDCLANFTSGQGLNALQAKKRLIKSVKTLRELNPETPIVLTDHAGYPYGEVYNPEKKKYQLLNLANKEAFESLKESGLKNIYLLKNKDLDLGQGDFIDGVHPNDAGMKKYAEAYTGLLLTLIE
ncbi:Lysophospholipase L1 [Salegentibacter holothuriorum]|uniref:Lysophospholipase L1 n=1 Tax=Salegentibacter holothuriorum TaxID=241145 RepID=A0A1T5DHL4_9FLAO|nr:SGNH/GDSL hydrolase family protein [Salegentibacter holothuriorum]SKB71127.1 Lysophospholipase L1 [Salegentibacter holothuriorum]